MSYYTDNSILEIEPGTSSFHDYDSVNSLISDWRAGNDRAAEVLYRRYAASVARVADFHLNAKFKERIGTEDLVQIVFLAIFTRLKSDGIHFRSDASFGCWVRRFARNKVRKCIRFEIALKRSIDREAGSMDEPNANASSDHVVTASQVTPLDQLIHNETLAKLRRTLDRTCFQIVQLLLAGYQQIEIAANVQLSPRTIRRKMNVIRAAVLDFQQTG